MNELYLRVRMTEQIIDQFLAVELVAIPYPVLIIHHKVFDLQYQGDRIDGCFFNAIKHKKDPWFPCSLFSSHAAGGGNTRLYANDITAQIQDGQV